MALPAAWRRGEESFASGMERLKSHVVMEKFGVEDRRERLWSQVGALLDAAENVSTEQATASWEALRTSAVCTEEQKIEKDARELLREIVMAFLGDEGASMRELFPCHSDGLQALMASIDRFGKVEDPTRGSAVVSVYSPDTWRGKDFEEAFNRWTAAVSRARTVGHETPVEVALTLVEQGMLSCGEQELARSVFSGRAYAEIKELEEAVRVTLAEKDRRNLARQEGVSRQAGLVSAVKSEIDSGRKKKFRKADRARKCKSSEARPAGKGVGAVNSSPGGGSGPGPVPGVEATGRSSTRPREHNKAEDGTALRGSSEPTSGISTAEDAEEYGAAYWRSKEVPSPEDLALRMNDPDFQEVLHMWNEIAGLMEDLAPEELEDWDLIDEDIPVSSQAGVIPEQGGGLATLGTGEGVPPSLEEKNLNDHREGDVDRQGNKVRREHQVGWEPASSKDGTTQHLEGAKAEYRVGWESASSKDGAAQHLAGGKGELTQVRAPPGNHTRGGC